jgi:hypothetical protein
VISEASDSVSLSERIPVPVASAPTPNKKTHKSANFSYSSLGNSRRQVSFENGFKLLLDDSF